MKIVYCGYHGLYISALAGYIHLWDLKTIEMRNKGYFLEWIDSINRSWLKSPGNLFYLGLDKDYNEVYSLGCKNAFDIIEKAQRGITAMYRDLDEKIYHVDLRGLEGWLYRLALDNIFESTILQGAATQYVRYYIQRQMEKVLKRVLLVKKAIKDGELL
ncbi:MAG: DUF3189 family protein [Mahellales bacterium]|jgi:hypothetical protein